MKKNNTKYQHAIDILTSQGKFYINLGLERVQKVLELMNNPQDKLRFIHVAGTNGKGSVCAMLSAILQETGKSKQGKERCVEAKMSRCVEDNSHASTPPHLYSFNKVSPPAKIGLFTSPHVFEYTERIKINDIEIEKEVFAKKIIEIVQLAEKNEIHLTEFEILTAVAFDYFAQNNIDIVVLETGLGGRLDATNVIKENVCSIITHIDFDHTERLGNTIEQIATEKAGIIKKNCPVIISQNNAGYETIKKIAKEKKATLIKIKKNCCHCEQSEAIQETVSFGLPRRNFVSPRNDITSFNRNKLSLKGTYQQENLSLVLSAIELLNKNDFNISQEQIKEGLKNVKHPCRFEHLEQENILIDGAHNPNGTKNLRESLDEYYPNQAFNFIFGCLNNKNYSKMMENLFTKDDKIYFYQFDNPNSCSFEELSKACKYIAKPFEDYKKDDKLTVICGSFYMIKELLSKMGIK